MSAPASLLPNAILMINADHLPESPVIEVDLGDDAASPTVDVVRPGPDTLLREDRVNRARWRIWVVAALECADPAAVEPPPPRIEATYLAMKNAAATVGDNLAAGKFFIREKEWARVRHRQLVVTRLRHRLKRLRHAVMRRRPDAVQPDSREGGHGDSSRTASSADGATQPSGDGSTPHPPTAPEGDTTPANATTQHAPSEMDGESPNHVDTNDQPSATEGGDQGPASKANQRARDPGISIPAANPVLPVLYAYLANKLFQLAAAYGEKPQRVIYLSVTVVVVWALGFATIWGPAGFDTPLNVPPYGAPYGYLLVSLASFVALVMGGTTIIASPTLRLAALIEGFLGAFLIGLFVFTLTRSVHR